jgi:sugar diacid utilization regulator
LSGAIDEGLLGRAREVGWSIESKRVVMAVRAYPRRGDVGWESAAVHASDFNDVEYRLITSVAEGESPGHVTVRKGDGVVILCDAAPEADAREVKRQVTGLAAALTRVLGSPQRVARVGIGGFADGPVQLRRSYAEARTALAVGAKLLPARLVWHIDDIAGYQFLAQGFSAYDRKVFVDSVLGPLLAHDQRRQGELVKTLKIYMEQLGNTSSAARALFVHRNTLGYRLKRIGALLGYDPVALPQRTTVEIALALWTMTADDTGRPAMGTVHKLGRKIQTA